MTLPDVSRAPATDGITLREALALPQLRGARVLAGAEGLARRVRYVNVMEVPDILSWVKRDELLLTTAYPLRDKQASLAELVPQLAARGLAGLAVKPARYLDAVPRVMLEAADRLAFPLLDLPPETVLADIINAVLGMILNAQALRLERSAAVHERFTRIVLSGGGLREIAEALAELLGRPVAIADPRGQLLARSARFPSLGDGACVFPESEGKDGLRWVSLTRSGGLPPIALQPIQAGRERHGAVLVLTEDGQLADDERMAVQHAATVAALRLVQARALAEADLRFRAVCLDELVTGHVAERALLHERAAAFGWDLSVPRAVLAAEIETLRGRPFLQIAGTAEEGRARHRLAEAALAVLGRDAIVWERSAGVAALVAREPLRAEAPRSLGSALQARASQRLPEAVIGVGIGRVYADPLDLRASYAEALCALAVGRQADGPGQVSLFEALGIERLLLSCPETELAAFHDALLGPLIAYERAHHGCGLLETLQRFLASNGNVALAARSLYVHYNTMKYRLHRLEQILGPFVGDAKRCVSLDLALTAGRLLARADVGVRPSLSSALPEGVKVNH